MTRGIKELIEKLKFDGNGLIPAIIQDFENNEILMMAYMNKETLEKTLATGQAHFWSRSKNRIWKKGETSGHVQLVKEILYDCDEDTLLIKVEQKVAACHTGHRTCFYRRITPPTPPEEVYRENIIERIYDVVLDRKRNPKEDSYVSSLLRGGKDKILKKISEEAGELILGSKNEDRKEIIYEMADLWFHTLVVLGYHEITPSEIYEELKRRSGKPGRKNSEKEE